MLTLLLSTLLHLASAPGPQSTSTFDEARAKTHYEAYFYELFARDWPEDERRTRTLRVSASRPRPAVVLGASPLDPSRGIGCNSHGGSRNLIRWDSVGETGQPAAHPVKSRVCGLGDMSRAIHFGTKEDVAPDLCVERPGTTGAWLGAAACYFTVRSNFGTPGFWVALREVQGLVVVAGVLEHEEALAQPLKDRGLAPFLDAVEARFASTFDEARARAHYESFFYERFMRDWPDDNERANNLKGSASRPRPAVKVDPWPVDPVRGLYCNKSNQLARFEWVAIGRTEPPTQQPVQEPAICALSDMSYHFYYGFKGHVAPDLCVERPGTTAAWQGAAACYFSARAEYYNPGFWVALREVNGRVVIAGVLEHKEYLEEPEVDRRLNPFLDAIEKRFGPNPDPRTTKPGKRP